MSGHRVSPPPFVLPLAVLQSVLCGADALHPVQTGAAGAASLTLLGNGSLIYQVRIRATEQVWGGTLGSLMLHSVTPSPLHQVQVVGTSSEVVAVTLETKPQWRDQRIVLCHMTGGQLGGYTVSVAEGFPCICVCV